MEEIMKELAKIGAREFTKHLIEDVVGVAITKHNNMEATGRAIGHIAVAYALLMIVEDQMKVPPPRETIFAVAKELGENEAKRLLVELGLMKAMDKAGRVPGNDPDVKQSWSSQI